MSTVTEKTNLAEEYADSLAGTLADIWTAIDADGEYEGQDAREYLDEMPLEIVWRKGSPFEVLLTFGGPNAWIEQDARYDDVELKVAWGGDRAERRSEAIARTAEYFRECVDMGDES